MGGGGPTQALHLTTGRSAPTGISTGSTGIGDTLYVHGMYQCRVHLPLGCQAIMRRSAKSVHWNSLAALLIASIARAHPPPSGLVTCSKNFVTDEMSVRACEVST